MRFKYGLKAQKLLAQGIALGIKAISKAPCKGKSLSLPWSFKAFALTIIFALGKIKRYFPPDYGKCESV